MTPSRRLRALEVRHRLQGRLHLIVGAAGIATLGAGVAVLFTTDRDARSAFLLTLGLALLLFALLRGRIQLEGFEILGAKARVREVVKHRLELAESPDRGQPADAASLHRQAVMLQQLVGLYGLYEHIRRAEPPGPRRTQALDQLAARMRAAGREAEFDPAEVIGWFHEGTDALRVIALNLMLANDEYRDFLAVLETVETPHSLFEQFYGLLLAEAMLPHLDALQQRLLRDAITRARRKRRFRRDAPLAGLSERLLVRLGKGS
jgi:hypothetical protein